MLPKSDGWPKPPGLRDDWVEECLVKTLKHFDQLHSEDPFGEAKDPFGQATVPCLIKGESDCAHLGGKLFGDFQAKLRCSVL